MEIGDRAAPVFELPSSRQSDNDALNRSRMEVLYVVSKDNDSTSSVHKSIEINEGAYVTLIRAHT